MQVTLKELAALVGGELQAPPDHLVSGLKGLDEAGPGDVAFLANPKYVKALPGCKAGVVLVSRDQKIPQGLPVIRVDNPYLAYAKLLTVANQKPYQALGVHPRAVVENSATLGQEVSIHALAYVGPGARIGDRVVLHPGVYVGENAQVGDDSELRPNVVLSAGCRVGRRCLIHGGTVIGADGYGFVPDEKGHFKIPQVGIAVLEDDVELGALNAVDRAATGETRIKNGVKTDNHVHIAHNCVIGEHTLLVAQVGISGSTTVGDNVVMGGRVGTAGHIHIGNNVKVAAMSGVAQSVEDGQVISGFPAMPHRLWLRTRSLIRRLPELFDRVKELEKRLGKS